LVDGCSLAIFKGLKCNYHYNRPDVQCEVVVMDQPSIMSFDQHVVQNILQFAGGWDNWGIRVSIPMSRYSKNATVEEAN
jgi:hypothetical protein